MGDMHASVEKDPYMQAYITARMKNQVEEMKLQKTLSSMEVSQRVRKIMINLELYEDRKMAHKLKQEVLNIANRQRQAMNHYVRSQRGTRSLGTLTAKSGMTWASTQGRSDRDGPPSSTGGDLHHPSSHPHQHQHHHQHQHSNQHHHDHNHPLHTHPATAPPTGKRGIYPVTKGKEYGAVRLTDCDHPPQVKKDAFATTTAAAPVCESSVPVIEISDYSEAQAAEKTDSGAGCTKTPVDEGALCTSTPHLSPEEIKAAAAAAVAATTAAAAHKPTVTYASDKQEQGQVPTSAGQGRQSCSKSRAESDQRVFFPPVASHRQPTRTQSMRTFVSRTTTTGGSKRELPQRVTSAGIWPGDPKAIRSVRRQRRDVEEMLATMKAGEETRRLVRESTRTCSRNCNKPNILTLMERTYVNLPDLLPEIEKARQRMAEQEAAERDQPLDYPLSSAGKRRRNTGRFDIDEDDTAGGRNLPIYHIQYTALRDMGGTRRNSVFA